MFLSGEFLLHIPCLVYFYWGSFSYTSRAGFIFIGGVSLTHSVLLSLLCGEFHTSQAAFIFMWGVSLTHPILACFYAGSFSYTFRADLSFFYVGSFSYTSRAGFFKILCEELLFAAAYSEDNPLRKELGGS